MRVIILGAAIAAAAGAASAQCPDGRLPPNNDLRLCGARPAARALDTTKLAILPARVSGADASLSYLRDGLVDILSAQFTGGIGPTAIDAADAVTAWDRIAGKEPPTRASVLRVARELGAGQVAYSTVTGSTRHFVLTTTILNVHDGSVRVPTVQVEGEEDSLTVAVSRLSARLLGTTEGAWKVSAEDPGTTSHEALHAYLNGMTAYRKRLSDDARHEFERALAIDSTFASAAYRLTVMRAMEGPSVTFPAFRHAWRERSRLISEQRVLLEAIADSNGMLFRAQSLPRLEHAMPVLGGSGEAWEILGDLYFHVGALTGREHWADSARAALLRAVRLEKKSCPCHSGRQHLADLAFLQGNRGEVLQYSVQPVYDRYRAAVLGGNETEIRAARAPYIKEISEHPPSFPEWLAGISLPHSEADSILAGFERYATANRGRQQWASWTSAARMLEGRFKEAATVVPPTDSVAEDLSRIAAGEFDSASAARLWTQIGGNIRGIVSNACDIALAKLRYGDTTGVAAFIKTLPTAMSGAPVASFRDLSNETRRQRTLQELQTEGSRPPPAAPRRAVAFVDPILCREWVGGFLASYKPSGLPQLARADSIASLMPMNLGNQNYDLAVAFARRGEFKSALASVRRRWMTPPPVPRLVISLRQEGRWAAMTGDTAGAIQAYRHYLLWRENPEPAFIPQRDSVRAELAALQAAQRRKSRK